MKKKIIVIVLIVVIVIMVCAFILKHMADSFKVQAAELEGEIVTILGEIDELEKQKHELTQKNATLLNDKKAQEDKKTEISNNMVGYDEEIKMLEITMPRADLSFTVESFNLSISVVAHETKNDKKDKYLEPFTTLPTVDKNDRGDEVLTYYLEGDKSSKYVSLSYTLNRYNNNVMEISLNCKGKDMKASYDECKSMLATTFVMINDSSFYDEKHIEEGKKILEDKKYLEGKVVIEEENTEEITTLTIKPVES